MNTEIRESEYKGNTVMDIVNTEAKYSRPFSFGQAKAKLMVKHMKAIKAFADTGKVSSKVEEDEVEEFF